MKKQWINVSVFIVLVSLTFYACKKDTKEPELKSYLSYQEKNYELTKGIIEFYGEYNTNPSTFNFDVTLFSSGLSYNALTEDVSGKGHAVYFELFSASETELVPGTYTYDAIATGDAESFDSGWFVLDYDALTSTSVVESSIKSGTVQVVKSGSTYQITINCIDQHNIEFSGYFEGSLDYYDNSIAKKTTKSKNQNR